MLLSKNILNLILNERAQCKTDEAYRLDNQKNPKKGGHNNGDNPYNLLLYVLGLISFKLNQLFTLATFRTIYHVKDGKVANNQINKEIKHA